MDTEEKLKEMQQYVIEGDYGKAISEVTELLKQSPDNTDALYIKAVSERYLKNYDAALTSLEKLKSLDPENGRAWQEQGHVMRSIQQNNAAIRAYSFAVQYNPALLASHQYLHDLLLDAKRQNQANLIAEKMAYLNGLPKALIAVTDLLAQGKIFKAEDICRRFLEKNPHHPEAMRLLADIGMRLGALDDTEFLLESAVDLYPNNTRIRVDYIQALRKRQKFYKAREQALHLYKMQPENLQFKSIFAIESMQTGDFDIAISEFNEILKNAPDDCITLTSLGHAYKTQGQQSNAIQCYQKAIKKVPQHGEAFYSLANLKVYEFSEDEIQIMQKQEQDTDLSLMQRVYLDFALGKAFEDLKDFDQAFHYYKKGNSLKKVQNHYDPDIITGDFKAQIEACNEELFSKFADCGFPAPDPIFIVGLPRAGSTLLEQILSSHSQIDGTLELPNILSLSQRLRRLGREEKHSEYPFILNELSPEFLRELGEEYILDTQIHRANAPFFIDKMPNNFRHLGLIKLILPNAKVIDARRNPMDCCFSGYKQLFAEGQEFSYSLSDIGRYYCDYIMLMEHWEKVLDGQHIRVTNEDVIEDLESQVRRMLDFLELPFEENCLRFHETERSIRTPSSEQVRQPIQSSGFGRWRPFEKYLTPLKEVLGQESLDKSVGA